MSYVTGKLNRKSECSAPFHPPFLPPSLPSSLVFLHHLCRGEYPANEREMGLVLCRVFRSSCCCCVSYFSVPGVLGFGERVCREGGCEGGGAEREGEREGGREGGRGGRG